MGACNFYSHAGIVVDIDAVVPRKPEFTVFYDKIPLGITDVKAVCGSGNAPGGARPDGDLTAFEMQAMDIPVSYETASGGGINGDIFQGTVGRIPNGDCEDAVFIMPEIIAVSAMKMLLCKIRIRGIKPHGIGIHSLLDRLEHPGQFPDQFMHTGVCFFIPAVFYIFIFIGTEFHAVFAARRIAVRIKGTYNSKMHLVGNGFTGGKGTFDIAAVRCDLRYNAGAGKRGFFPVPVKNQIPDHNPVCAADRKIGLTCFENKFTSLAV